MSFQTPSWWERDDGSSVVSENVLITVMTPPDFSVLMLCPNVEIQRVVSNEFLGRLCSYLYLISLFMAATAIWSARFPKPRTHPAFQALSHALPTCRLCSLMPCIMGDGGPPCELSELEVYIVEDFTFFLFPWPVTELHRWCCTGAFAFLLDGDLEAETQGGVTMRHFTTSEPTDVFFCRYCCSLFVPGCRYQESTLLFTNTG